MGGNHLGVGKDAEESSFLSTNFISLIVGNVTKCAEFNFWSDPEAVFIVFEESKCPIYIFPWEPCRVAGTAMPFIDWRIKELSKNNNSFTSLLDPVEKKAYIDIIPSWAPCDNFLVCCFILPKMIKKIKERHVTVELSGIHTRGQMIIDHLNKQKPNAFIIEEIDVELFKKFMLWVCEHKVDDFDF